MTFLFLLLLTVLIIVALRKNARLQKETLELKLRLDEVAGQLDHLRARGLAVPPPEARAVEQLPNEVQEIEPDLITEPVASEEPANKPITVETVSRPSSFNWRSTTASPEVPVSTVASSEAAPSPDVEQALASRWFVWIGGLAIAIGGVLFVKYAFDSGWISPLLRCLLGFAGGLILVAGGEYLRRTPLMRSQPSYVPAALSAAGLVIAFGSVYAAYAFYQLISPTAAFLIMAALALGAFALSLLQGPLIAALGLLGSYATPTLIPSENPSALAFFPYVFIILAASLAVLRVRAWWWLGFAAVSGSLVWGLLWAHGGIFETADALPVGLFAIALGGASLFAISGRAILDRGSGRFDSEEPPSPPLAIGLAGLGGGLLILCSNAIAAGHDNVSLLLLLAGCAGILAVAWQKPGIAVISLITAVFAWLSIGAWSSASFTQIAYEEWGTAAVLIGPGASRYLAWLGILGTMFVATGYAGARIKEEPVPWSILATGAPLLFGLAGVLRAHDVFSIAQWATGGFLLAVIFAVAIWSIRARAADTPGNHALGVLAIGAVSLAAYGLYEALDHLWLTLGLSMLVPVVALASTRLRINAFGAISAALAALVIVRLFLGREIWLGDVTLPLGRHWPLYAYGVPAILFWLSSRVFKRSDYPKAVAALEGSALGLVIALISMELRVIIAGDVRADSPGLLEVAAHAIAWLGAAYGLIHRQAIFSSLVSLWGSRVLIAAGTAIVVVGNLVVLNPVTTGDPVAGGPVLNALLLAYLAPAILGAMLTRQLYLLGWERMRVPGDIISLILLLAYLTLETKRLFQGAVMVVWAQSDAENYAYSAIWLLAALGLFVAGIRMDKKYVRLAGLAVMGLVVLKVFLIDLSGIGGLYRIASFIGLGLCLVGIGWLYTRYVQKPSPVPQTGG